MGHILLPLDHFTVFVGPNGAGKSNFIDALAFIQQCLSESVEMAIKSRGGIRAVRRRSAGHPTHIFILLELILDNELTSYYSFQIAAKAQEKFKIVNEYCIISQQEKVRGIFRVKEGEFTREIPGIRVKISPDRLALYAASATDEFRPVYDFLTSMRFYSIAPNRLRELQEPDAGEYLKRDGSNAAAVLKSIEEKDKTAFDRICRLLGKVAGGLKKVEYRSLGQKETLLFRQDVGTKAPWKFDALNMSDGTLRVLGLLLSAYQPGNHSVIAIEEPESTVNPAIAEIVFQVLKEASSSRQVLITTHSPDILDQKELSDEQIRVVTMDRGRTLISPVSEASRQAIREKLYTPGELLRIDELTPALDDSE